MVQTRKPTSGRKPPSHRQRRCASRGCIEPIHARGYCQACYRQRRRHQLVQTASDGRALPVDDYTERCAIRNCASQLCDQGLCVSHLIELLSRAPKGGVIFRDAPETSCAVRDCRRPRGERGVCVVHRGLLVELAERLPEGLSEEAPEIQFEMQRVTLDDIDLGDASFEMRLDYSRIDEMAASISRWGIIQNVILHRVRGQKRLVVVAGQRRLNGARHLVSSGKRVGEFWALIAPPDTPVATLRALAAHENVKRDRVSIYEMALLAHARRQEGLDIVEIAEQLGVVARTVERYLALIDKAAPATLSALRRNRGFSFGHAKLIWSLPHRQQEKWVDRVIEAKLPINGLRDELRKANHRTKKRRAHAMLDGRYDFVNGPGPRKRGPYKFAIELSTMVEVQLLAELVEELDRRHRKNKTKENKK